MHVICVGGYSTVFVCDPGRIIKEGVILDLHGIAQPIEHPGYIATVVKLADFFRATAWSQGISRQVVGNIANDSSGFLCGTTRQSSIPTLRWKEQF